MEKVINAAEHYLECQSRTRNECRNANPERGLAKLWEERNEEGASTFPLDDLMIGLVNYLNANANINTRVDKSYMFYYYFKTNNIIK